MNQTKYLDKLLNKFKMMDCNPKPTPSDLGVNKVIDSDSKELGDAKLYREIIVSCLIYVMMGARSDLRYVFTKLSQHMAKPTKARLGMAKHVLKYIKRTVSLDLKFQKSNGTLKSIGFCDSDWSASKDKRSITCYSFQLNSDGSLISWKSKKQQTVALSICEAEYMALTTAMQEANFLRQLFVDMQGDDKESVTLYSDNQGAIALAKNLVHHQRPKHIDIKYHFIKIQVQNDIVELQYVPSEGSVEVVFTKPVSKARLNKFTIMRGAT